VAKSNTFAGRTSASCLTNRFSGLSGYPGSLASAAGGSVLESLRSSLDAFAWLQSVSKSPPAVPLIFQAIGGHEHGQRTPGTVIHDLARSEGPAEH